MMKKHFPASLLCVAVVLGFLAVPGAAAKETSSTTVGRFAVELSQALGARVTGEQSAAQKLKARGVTLQIDLSARLTHEVAARILSDLGMKVAPVSNPAGEISRGMATQLAATAGIALQSRTGIALDEFPVICLTEKNHGHCTNCCKAALAGEDPEEGSIARLCAHFCTSPPSASDPEPEP